MHKIMSPASRALSFFLLITHSLRCGLQVCRQLRWLWSIYIFSGLPVLLSLRNFIYAAFNKFMDFIFMDFIMQHSNNCRMLI